MIKKYVLAAAVAGVLLAASPMAANAATSTDDYTTPNGATIDPSIIDPCGTAYVDFPAGYWASAERVEVTVSGARSAQVLFDSPVNAAGDGSLHSALHAPSDAPGVYNVTYAAASRTYSGAITVTDDIINDPSCKTVSTASLTTGSTSALATTGGDVPIWAIGVGGGLLVSGAVLVAITAVRRRRTN